jgi:chromosomal replication initiator protein
MKQWEKFITAQEKELGKEVVDRWLKPFKVVHFDAANLYLEARDAFQLSWFEEHIRPKLRKAFFNDNGRLIKVHLSSPIPAKSKKAFKPRLDLAPDPLDPQSTFNTYIGNTISVQLFKDALEKRSDNPLYLFGPSGVGKSHLLMAAAHFFQQKKLSCFYVRTETFTQHVVSAIRNSAMEKFRQLYRRADALLLDDVDILAHKAATQEEFFHTFNTLHTLGKPIILSASSSPTSLKEIEPRLTSRFEWGLVLPLQKLTLPELEEILVSRIKAMEFQLKAEVAQFLLANFQRSPKILISAFDTLILRSHLEKLSPSDLHLNKAQFFLSKFLEEEKKIALTPEKIMQNVAEFYGIKVEDIWGESQTQECALPRQVSMYLCRTLLKLPFMKIGKIFDRDHSTVMASVRAIQKRIDLKDLHIPMP